MNDFWMNVWMSEWISVRMSEWMNVWLSEWISVYMNMWMSEWISVRMTEGMNVWMSACLTSCWVDVEWILQTQSDTLSLIAFQLVEVPMPPIHPPNRVFWKCYTCLNDVDVGVFVCSLGTAYWHFANTFLKPEKTLLRPPALQGSVKAKVSCDAGSKHVNGWKER